MDQRYKGVTARNDTLKSNCEEYYIGKKIEKRVKKVLTKEKRCDSISKLSARAAEKSKNSEKFEEN